MNKRGLLDLIIARLPGLSLRDKISLCRNYDSEEDFFRMETSIDVDIDAESVIARLPGILRNIDAIRIQAEQDARFMRMRGISYVAWADPAYPPLLREIYDPPVLLYYRGSLPDPLRPLAAIVGTRRPGPQAACQAYDIGYGLGKAGVSVVSGLALGIDAMAHRGNLEAGRPTFAILGSGVDEIYPRTNRLLARRILETGGGIFSEYPMGTHPFKSNFPARNRIISGMARGVVIVQAPESSGALITARLALEHNRDLWVASAGVHASTPDEVRFDRRGSAKLAEDGAAVITGACDILREWNMDAPDSGASGMNDDKNRSSAAENACGRELAEAFARSIHMEL
ncbi:MAG: DNA-processing protein DprA [Treponema sp.]|nr:DNA-processing protein DprA [Treponema sp.]